MTLVGKSCIDEEDSTNYTGVYTYILNHQIPLTGIIHTWCVYKTTAGSVSMKMKIFRNDGTNWNYISQSSLETVVQGLNSFSTNISVQINDYIAFYISADCPIDSESSQLTHWYKSGDITSNSLISSWVLNWLYTLSFSVSLGLSNVYVNSSTGNDTYAGDSCVAGHPVQTFAKAYLLIDSGGTIHICNNLADFSSETVTLNKSFSVDLNGAAGYFYMPQAS